MNCMISIFNNYQSIYENCPALFACGVTKVLIHNSQITVQQYRLVAERIKLASTDLLSSLLHKNQSGFEYGMQNNRSLQNDLH